MEWEIETCIRCCGNMEQKAGRKGLLFINKKVIGEPGKSYVGGRCVTEPNWRRGLRKTAGGKSEL